MVSVPSHMNPIYNPSSCFSQIKWLNFIQVTQCELLLILLEFVLKVHSDERFLLLLDYERVHFPPLYLIYSPVLYLSIRKNKYCPRSYTGRFRFRYSASQCAPSTIYSLSPPTLASWLQIIKQVAPLKQVTE